MKEERWETSPMTQARSGRRTREGIVVVDGKGRKEEEEGGGPRSW